MGTISTNGSARREFTADITEIRFEVIKTSADQQTAMREGRTETERLLAVLDGLGYPPEKLTMEQEQVTRYHNYRQNEENESFQFSKVVNLRIRTDMTAFNAITAAVETDGISVQYSERFLLSDREKCENKVMVEALGNSRAKAAILAESLGGQIRGAQSVTDSDAGGGVELLRAVPAAAAPDNSLAARLSPDVIVIEKHVTAVWEF